MRKNIYLSGRWASPSGACSSEVCWRKRPSPRPSQPKSGLPDFGPLLMPKSGKPDFVCEERGEGTQAPPSAPAERAGQHRADQLPTLAVEALHLHLLDRIEIVGAGVDRDARQQHAELEVMQVGGLLHHIGAREVVAALPEHLHERLRDRVAVRREARG